MSAGLLSLSWLLLGAFILLSYTVEAMTGFVSIVIALSLGALVLGVCLGNFLHHRVDEGRFRRVIYAVLLIAGMALVGA